MGAFNAGSKTFFNQATAPSGWTKAVTNDDYTLRLVNTGTGGTLTGSTGVVSAFKDYTSLVTFPGTISSTVSSVLGDTPSHSHPYSGLVMGSPTTWRTTATTPGGGFINGATIGGYPSSTYGSGSTHTHSISVAGTATAANVNFSIKYVDFILATKN